MAVISIESFTKSFGSKKVVSDLSFEIEKGEIFAFLGANGSGKTTTLRSLLRIYQPDSGSLLINGTPYSSEMANLLGYLPEERGLYINTSVIDTMTYFAELKGLSTKEAKDKSLEYLDKVGLGDKSKLKINKLSSGQQQKIQFGITIINQPEILILDEPTKGLDPVNRGIFMDMIFEMNRKGTTVLFSTHNMDEVERIADRLVMIKNGERKLYGKVDEVKKSFGNNNIKITFEGNLPENSVLYTFRAENHSANITPNKDIKASEILKYLISQNVDIKQFEISAPSLNDIFVKVSADE